jgi:hypothetical protein
MPAMLVLQLVRASPCPGGTNNDAAEYPMGPKKSQTARNFSETQIYIQLRTLFSCSLFLLSEVPLMLLFHKPMKACHPGFAGFCGRVNQCDKVCCLQEAHMPQDPSTATCF